MAKQEQLDLEHFIDFLVEGKYRDIVIINNKYYAAILPFVFTHAIIIGHLGDYDGYGNRWCYANYAKALKGLKEWEEAKFAGEPQGWHRHPDSGRRRPDGDAEKEYINF